MDLTSLPMGSVILADDHLHALIRKSITSSGNKALGIKIVSLSTFLASYIPQSAPSLHQVLFMVYKRLQALDKDFTTYQNILFSKDFLEECYQLLNDLATWDIPLDALPKESEAQKELLTILHLFDDIVFPNQLIYQTRKQLEMMDFSNVYILDTYNTLAQHSLLQLLIKQGATLCCFPKEEQTITFYHAVNKRQEIEACAQHILVHQYDVEDIHITLCDPSYNKLIEQVFQRYHIPFTILHQESSSQLSKQLTALLKYVLQPDCEHLCACLDAELFTGSDIHALREYIQIFDADIFQTFQHLQKVEEIGNLMNAYNWKQLQALEEKAATAQRAILPFFHSLKNSQDIKTSIELVMNELRQHVQSDEDQSIYRKIATILCDLANDIHTKEDLIFLVPFFENITPVKKPSTYQGILIHHHQQEVLPRKYHYLLGATQTNYPAFQTKQGIFDEAYYALIEGYPSMEERYTHYMEQLKKMLSHSKHLIFSYPVGTYEGKSMEAALEIEQYAGSVSIPYPLHENYEESPLQDHLSSEMAKQLFVKEGYLKGSISSFERYVKCPFSYFLRYGLSIKEPMKPGFPDAYAGTLFHYILETLTNTYGKKYATKGICQIQTIVDQELAYLTHIFPNMQQLLNNVKERLLVSMTQTLKTLAEFEKHSQFRPSASELEFHYELPVQEDVAIALHGFIDRLDVSANFASILDYKSSVKTLSETSVFAALQLQLLTYAMVIQKQQQKEIMGTYYISLKNENINCKAGSISRRKPVTYNEYSRTDYLMMKHKAQRFNGWTMQKDVALLDDNASHIVGLRINKDGIIKAGKLYNLEAITNYMERMYGLLAQRILNGDIACKPLESACDYCNYHAICRFKGFYSDRQQLLKPQDDLYWDGGEENA